MLDWPIRVMAVFAGFTHAKSAFTPVATASPVLQTRTPTGKMSGPSLTLLLSSPMTFQVIGVTDS